MIVDDSHLAWVRPTRRVHLALSVGMTVTGVILIALGMPGGRGAAQPAVPFRQTADTVVTGGEGDGGPANPVPAAPLVHFAPPAPRTLTLTPGAEPERPKPRPRPAATHPAAHPTPHRGAHPSDVSRPPVPPTPPSPPTSPAPLPTHPPMR